jgi:hypothetical protein
MPRGLMPHVLVLDGGHRRGHLIFLKHKDAKTRRRKEQTAAFLNVLVE